MRQERRNYRIESEVLVETELSNGAKVVTASHSYSAYELTCTCCGAEFTSKGIFGGLREIMFGELCEACCPEPENLD